MGIFDWFRTAAEEPEDAGMSRRDFFARFAGRGTASGDDAGAPAAEAEDPNVLHRFGVTSFPYHDGPVLVPILRAGEEYQLTPDPPYSREPTGLRIQRGRDTLGVVPPQLAGDLLERLSRGERLVCRAVRIEPTTDLANVLTVEIARLPQPQSPVEAEVPDGIEGADAGAANPESSAS